MQSSAFEIYYRTTEEEKKYGNKFAMVLKCEYSQFSYIILTVVCIDHHDVYLMLQAIALTVYVTRWSAVLDGFLYILYSHLCLSDSRGNSQVP